MSVADSKKPQCSVIMLTARGENDRILGLELGAVIILSSQPEEFCQDCAITAPVMIMTPDRPLFIALEGLKLTLTIIGSKSREGMWLSPEVEILHLQLPRGTVMDREQMCQRLGVIILAIPELLILHISASARKLIKPIQIRSDFGVCGGYKFEAENENSFLVRRFYFASGSSYSLTALTASSTHLSPNRFSRIKVKGYLLLTSFRAGLPALPVMTLFVKIHLPCLTPYSAIDLFSDQQGIKLHTEIEFESQQARDTLLKHMSPSADVRFR